MPCFNLSLVFRERNQNVLEGLDRATGEFLISEINRDAIKINAKSIFTFQ
uniref:Uncharacterized protein n=1 Tax=Tetranychus urticae TaxID=32264 RepID=T1L1Q9_TETUR